VSDLKLSRNVLTNFIENHKHKIFYEYVPGGTGSDTCERTDAYDKVNSRLSYAYDPKKLTIFAEIISDKIRVINPLKTKRICFI
jgi:hypothetical protein